MGYTDEQWPHHCARMARIGDSGLYTEYTAVYSRIYDERIPNPFAVGNFAEAVISDECKIEASNEVCHMHDIDQYEDEEDAVELELAEEATEDFLERIGDEKFHEMRDEWVCQE